MFECIETKDVGLKWLVLSGRIDAMSAGEIGRKLDALLTAGERIIGADMEQVTYMSSAGIRVFLTAQKKLMRVDGQIVLAHVVPDVLNVLKMSGLDGLFRMVADRQEAVEAIQGHSMSQALVATTLEGIRFTYLKHDGGPGSLTLFGDTKGLIHASYGAEDMVTVQSPDIPFGLGLGTLGQEWDHYKGLFGEAMVINHHLFFYPAIKNPAVDFMLWSEGSPPIPYRFLNGLAFTGPYRYVASFEAGDRPTSLTGLVRAIFQISDAPLLGIVLLGESQGIWGMHLKRVPVKSLWPGPEVDILSPGQIQDWMDLPVEPGFAHHLVAGVGIAARQRSLLTPSLKAAIPEGQTFHIHGTIYGKELFATDPTGFEQELARVVAEFEPVRIEHLMGRSRLKNGMVGVIEIEPGGAHGTLDRRP